MPRYVISAVRRRSLVSEVARASPLLKAKKDSPPSIPPEGGLSCLRPKAD